jgi:LytS/YehU family sensor histidine kinase
LNIFPEAQLSVFQEDNFAFIPFTVMLLTTPFILVLQWFKQSNEITELAREKSANELNFLKQQINPHFFFNTLNNLYALSLKKDEATPEIILQLSELMRYVIYRGKEETVTLAEEVRHIEDYIRLQMLRMYKPLNFSFEQHIADENIKVPPLLFIVLVENAFKHGIEPAERESFLHICLTSNERGLTFVCENSVEERPKRTPGVGLSNLRRRLALRFPNRHELRLEAHEQSFKATLKLDLP